MRGLMQDYPLTITAILRRVLRYSPTKQVIQAAGPKTSVNTWEQVARRAIRLSNALRQMGVKSGDVVGSFAWNTHRHVELYFAVPCMGAVLHTINVRLHEEQIVNQIVESGDTVVFVDASLTATLASIKVKLGGSIQFVVLDDGGPIDPEFADALSFEDIIDGEAEEFEYPELSEDTAAVLCYTSGTTGRPKGVLYSHRSEVLHAMSAMSVDAFAISENDRILLAAPMFHVNGWGLPYAAAFAGASLVLTGRHNDPETLLRVLTEEQITLAAGVPTIWIGVDELLRRHNVRLEALRAILIGGATPSIGLIDRFAQRGVEVLQGWGMTETSPNASIARIHSAFRTADRDRQTRLRASQGIAVPGVEVRICDQSGHELAWDGVAAGEVEIRGPWIAGAYHGVSQVDQADSFHDGWLRTGDIATISPHGYINVFDRIKDVIKSGGEWISSAELEARLATHPGVQEVAVIGIPDPKWGERPAAIVVVREGEQLTPEELIAHVSPHVPRWWIPDAFRFCVEIPKTSVGKSDKKRIRLEWSATHA